MSPWFTFCRFAGAWGSLLTSAMLFAAKLPVQAEWCSKVSQNNNRFCFCCR
jgi:hypothetical protein